MVEKNWIKDKLFEAVFYANSKHIHFCIRTSICCLKSRNTILKEAILCINWVRFLNTRQHYAICHNFGKLSNNAFGSAVSYEISDKICSVDASCKIHIIKYTKIYYERPPMKNDSKSSIKRMFPMKGRTIRDVNYLAL